MTRARVIPALIAFLLAGCGGSASPDDGGTPLTAASVLPTPSPSDSPPPSLPHPADSPAPAGFSADSMVVTLVNELRVRAEPGLDAERLGTIPADEIAFVVDGPLNADGYAWYQLASDTTCSNPYDTRFHCNWWMGWVAGAAEGGSPWLEQSTEGCPSGALDVTTYLGMTALQRLSCFGEATWSLRAYIAPLGGERGGTSIVSTDPGWLDAWGTVIFPQLEEREHDSSSDLFMYAHPDLGCGFGGRNDGCAFEPFVGQWVEIQGHLDDPAAATCTPIYNPLWVEGLEEPLPPLPDVAETVLRCRSLFVATAVRAMP